MPVVRGLLMLAGWCGAQLVATAVSAAPAARTAKDSGPLIDLLRLPGAAVAVSSVVRNASNKPQHLVDGKLETAWNSRTGDVVGAWIAFRVPREATVVELRLTAGFAHATRREDLFLMNHRIRRVRLLREGKVLGEHALDPQKRALQTIAVGQPGGDFRVEVRETVVGTKARWREVCVSELEVRGRAPAALAARRATPLVRVGALPGAKATAATAQVESLASPTLAALKKRLGSDELALLCGAGGAFVAGVPSRRVIQINKQENTWCAFDPGYEVLWFSNMREQGKGSYVHDLYVQDLKSGGAPTLLVRGSPVPVGVSHDRETYQPPGEQDPAKATLELSKTGVVLTGEVVLPPVAINPEDRDDMERPGRKLVAKVKRLPVPGKALLAKLATRGASPSTAALCRDTRKSLTLDLSALGGTSGNECSTCGEALPVPRTSLFRVLLEPGNTHENTPPSYCLYDAATKRFLNANNPSQRSKEILDCGDTFDEAQVAASGKAYILGGEVYVLPRGKGKEELGDLAAQAAGWLTPACRVR